MKRGNKELLVVGDRVLVKPEQKERMRIDQRNIEQGRGRIEFDGLLQLKPLVR